MGGGKPFNHSCRTDGVWPNPAVAMQLEREGQAWELFREWGPLSSVATLSGRVTGPSPLPGI